MVAIASARHAEVTLPASWLLAPAPRRWVVSRVVKSYRLMLALGLRSNPGQGNIEKSGAVWGHPAKTSSTQSGQPPAGVISQGLSQARPPEKTTPPNTTCRVVKRRATPRWSQARGSNIRVLVLLLSIDRRLQDSVPIRLLHPPMPRRVYSGPGIKIMDIDTFLHRVDAPH